MSRLLLSIAAISVAFASVARAQSVEAETLFVEGEKLMAAGQYEKACDAFAASNRLEARAGTLIHLGMCEEKRERYASAWIAFREALTRVKDPVKQQFATERAAAVQAKLSYLTIELPDASKLDGLVVSRDGSPLDAALFGRAIPVDGGTHIVVARAPGRKSWSSSVAIAKSRDKSTVLVPVLEPEATIGATGANTANITTGDTSNAGIVDTGGTTPARDTGNRHTTLVVAFGAVGLAGLGVGIFGGMTARAFDRDATALCPDLDMPCAMADRANNLLDRRDARALVANIGVGVAAAGAIAATVAWLTGRSSAGTDVAVVPAPDGANILVRVPF
jgi:hypothetical protein